MRTGSIVDDALGRRLGSLRLRIGSLPAIRALVGLPAAHDLSARQWRVLESRLAAAAARLSARLDAAAGVLLHGPRAANELLGDLELDTAQAFAFFDTYMDVLTQRLSPALGPVLAGCDALARDALAVDHPVLQLVEPPLVYCARGFGASVLRQGVALPDQTPNPLPLIQLPYARLLEKLGLTSILHEAGHEAMARLELTARWPAIVAAALAAAGAPALLGELAGRWTYELGPDLWAWCCAGLAQAAALRDLLALPSAHVYRLSPHDPHPPPYLRVPIAIAWCRHAWGRGPWDAWLEAWDELYPLAAAPLEVRALLGAGRRHVDTIARAFLDARHPALGGRTVPALFDTDALAPASLRRRVTADRVVLTGLPPRAHLAVFRLLRDDRAADEPALDHLLATWLAALAAARPQ